MTERNEYVDALKSEFDAYSEKVTEIFDAYDESIDPGPEPIVPRPVLPADFRVQGRDRTVALSWSMPLPRETPGIQVQRRANDPSISGWRSLTKDAIDGWSDVIPESAVDLESVWIYRIRGYGYKADGTPHASPWSEELSYEIQIDPPVPPPGPGEFKAIDRAEKTAAENKLWRYPDILASRTGRVSDSPGDIRRGQWTQGDLVMENMESVVTGQWHSNMHVDTAPRPGKYIWKNIECRSAIEDVWATKNLWGAREHYVPERLVDDCDFSFMKEHGLYISPQEGSTVRRSTFVKVGSQGLQYAHRPVAKGSSYANNHSYTADPVYIVDDCHMVDCGRFAGRGSFSLTYFTCGNVDHPGTFKVSNSSFVANWDQPNNDYFGDYHSTGAMVVTAGSWDDGSNWSGGCQTKLIELKNNLYDYTTPDRSILSLRSFEDLVIEDCVFLMRNNSRGHPGLKVDSYVDDPTILSKMITLRNVYAPGVSGKVNGAGTFSMHCPDEELKIDARTGTVISRRPL